jgi:hypothetical protein
MTIDTLALAIQKDFDDVHIEMAEMKTEMAEMKTTMGGMATKDELKSTESKILLAIEKMDARLSAYMARTNEDISRLQGSDRDFDVRLRIIEKRA